ASAWSPAVRRCAPRPNRIIQVVSGFSRTTIVPVVSGFSRTVIADMARLSVLLTTEGTYPYHRGGVSTWCHALTNELSDIDFTVLAITMHPYLEPQYALAPNVQDVITVPLWGTEDPAEYGRHESFPDYLQRRWGTSRHDIEHE